jgi:ABC-2 type transport system ATP-binding protein
MFQGLSLTEARKKATEAVDLFGLQEYAGTKCQDLSGGYKRRVQAAKAFVAQTPLLILDEATSGMDAFAKRNVLDVIRRQAREGRTVLLTTQILSEAEELCDRIAIIDAGRVQAVGDVHSLKLGAREVYEAVVTFEQIPPDLLAFLDREAVTKLERRGATLVFHVNDVEANVLALLTEISRRWRVLHFEVSGASLEDVFVEVLRKRE